MEMTKIEKYRMMNTKNMPNVKDLVGEKVYPEAILCNEYTDADGEIHSVLAMRFRDHGCYRTEVKAFIEEMLKYWDVFGEDEEKPLIEITGKQSKRGNPYVSMVVVEE